MEKLKSVPSFVSKSASTSPPLCEPQLVRLHPSFASYQTYSQPSMLPQFMPPYQTGPSYPIPITEPQQHPPHMTMPPFVTMARKSNTPASSYLATESQQHPICNISSVDTHTCYRNHPRIQSIGGIVVEVYTIH